MQEAEFRQKPTHKKPNISKQLDHFRNQFYEQQQKDDERLQNRINELKDNLRKQIDDRKARRFRVGIATVLAVDCLKSAILIEFRATKVSKTKIQNKKIHFRRQLSAFKIKLIISSEFELNCEHSFWTMNYR